MSDTLTDARIWSSISTQELTNSANEYEAKLPNDAKVRNLVHRIRSEIARRSECDTCHCMYPCQTVADEWSKSDRASQLMAFADHVYAASEPTQEQLKKCARADAWREWLRPTHPYIDEATDDEVLEYAGIASERVEDTMTAEDRKEQFGEECAYCGKDSLTCEHFKPDQDSESRYSSRDEGRNPDGTGESYAERNT